MFVTNGGNDYLLDVEPGVDTPDFEVAKDARGVDDRPVGLVNRMLRCETLKAELRAVRQGSGIPDFRPVAREKTECAAPASPRRSTRPARTRA